jgi:enoyl-CoA hydratase/carnithine racemase
MAMNELVRFERKDGLGVITLANPDYNRLNRGVLAGLQQALQQVRQPGVRAVLLKAHGPVYSYGADVKDLFIDLPAKELPAILQAYLDLIGAIESMPVPTVAAVHGVCSSGGLELALAFDHLWAAAGTKIGFLEASIAIPPLAGGVQRVAARAGSIRAFEVATAGRLYDAEVFERWNIVNRIVDGATLHAEAEAFASKLAAGPTLAFAAVKRLVREAEAGGVAAADRIVLDTVGPALFSDDARSAAAALIAGGANWTPPAFTGR